MDTHQEQPTLEQLLARAKTIDDWRRCARALWERAHEQDDELRLARRGEERAQKALAAAERARDGAQAEAALARDHLRTATEEIRTMTGELERAKAKARRADDYAEVIRLLEDKVNQLEADLGMEQLARQRADKGVETLRARLDELDLGKLELQRRLLRDMYIELDGLQDRADSVRAHIKGILDTRI